MIALEIYHNGEKVATVGDSRTGMASFHISTQCFTDGATLDRAYAHANGFYGDINACLNFLELEGLKIDDEFTVKIVETNEVSDYKKQNLKVSFWTRLKLLFNR